MEKAVLLFIKNFNSTFVLNDEVILRHHFKVKSIECRIGSGLKTIYNQVRVLFWLLKNIRNSRYIYIWFADYHSFLPVLFGKIFEKRSVLVLGGYDVTYLPEIKYGSFSNPLRSFCTKFSIKNATLCLPVSDNIEKEAIERVPKAKTKIIYTGYSEDKFLPSKMGKQKIVLTVGAGDSLQRLRIKGIDFFVDVARVMPEYKFIVIGISNDALKYLKDVPNNVEILERMEQYELISFYQKAKVYAQFSMREGLPNALCEAMLCECVPVGSKVGGIPNVIGNCGYILETKNADKGAELISQALHANSELGKQARERIVVNFSQKNREDKLLALLSERQLSNAKGSLGP